MLCASTDSKNSSGSVDIKRHREYSDGVEINAFLAFVCQGIFIPAFGWVTG